MTKLGRCSPTAVVIKPPDEYVLAVDSNLFSPQHAQLHLSLIVFLATPPSARQFWSDDGLFLTLVFFGAFSLVAPLSIQWL